MPRLLVVTNIPTPYRTNFFNSLRTQLDSVGVNLFVVYCARSEWNRSWIYDEIENRYEHRILPGRSIKIGAITFHFNPAVIGHVFDERVQWLLSAGSWNMPTGLLALVASRYRLPLSMFWSEGHAAAVMHAYGPIAAVRRFILKRYQAFAVPNRRSADFLHHELQGRLSCVMLPNTVDDTFYVPLQSDRRAALRRSLGFFDGERLVVQIGQLEDRKGVLELLEAAARIFLVNSTLRLVLVGTGSLESKIRARYRKEIVENRIILAGQCTALEVRRWLHAADFFSLVSKQDPNPLSSIEAALAGTPLILSRAVGNVAELVLPDETGYIVERVMVEEIAQVLREVTVISELKIANMRKKSEEHARAQFCTEAVAREFVDSLLRLTGNAGENTQVVCC
jgi:glycosyltransferase involved in cell wall biosynthesis